MWLVPAMNRRQYRARMGRGKFTIVGWYVDVVGTDSAVSHTTPSSLYWMLRELSWLLARRPTKCMRDTVTGAGYTNSMTCSAAVESRAHMPVVGSPSDNVATSWLHPVYVDGVVAKSSCGDRKMWGSEHPGAVASRNSTWGSRVACSSSRMTSSRVARTVEDVSCMRATSMANASPSTDADVMSRDLANISPPSTMSILAWLRSRTSSKSTGRSAGNGVRASASWLSLSTSNVDHVPSTRYTVPAAPVHRVSAWALPPCTSNVNSSDREDAAVTATRPPAPAPDRYDVLGEMPPCA